MKRLYTVILLITVVFAGCKSEKKINSYSDIYSERPTTIYIAPVIDNAIRREVKYPKDAAYNNEINTASAYLNQTLAAPLLKKGYYVVGSVASREIAEATKMSNKQLRNGDMKSFGTDYGVDAVLIVTIHRWREKNGEWIACLEYQLRSTKSNVDLQHTWVIARKRVPTNLKGDPVVMKNDVKFAKRFDFDNGTAQRCFLVEKVNDYVLRDLPISSLKRQFEDDIYKNANPTYMTYIWTEDGSADVGTCSVEEFEEIAFL